MESTDHSRETEGEAGVRKGGGRRRRLRLRRRTSYMRHPHPHDPPIKVYTASHLSCRLSYPTSGILSPGTFVKSRVVTGTDRALRRWPIVSLSCPPLPSGHRFGTQKNGPFIHYRHNPPPTLRYTKADLKTRGTSRVLLFIRATYSCARVRVCVCAY